VSSGVVSSVPLTMSVGYPFATDDVRYGKDADHRIGGPRYACCAATEFRDIPCCVGKGVEEPQSLP
jgi:hypothetical protein